MAGMQNLMNGYADAAADTIGRWANGLRGAPPGVDMPGVSAVERPWTPADNVSFPSSPEAAAAEAAHGARVNPAAPASNYTSPGYQDHFAPQGAPASEAAAGEAGAANAGKFAGARNFFSGGAGDVGGAIKNVAGGLVEPVKGLARGNVLLGGALGVAEGAGTDTSDYERRFGLAPNTDTGPAGFARDVGVRALGVASDVGNRIGLGLPKQFLYRDGPNGDAPSTPATTAQAAAPAAGTGANPNATTDVQRGGANAGNFTVTPTGATDGLRRIDGGSSPLFTNTEDGGLTGNAALLARGSQPNAQNAAAGDALAARYGGSGAALLAKEQNDREVADATATNAQPARVDTGGYGLRDSSALATRNANVDNGALPEGGQVSFSSGHGQGARLASAERIAAAGNATSDRNSQRSAATQLADAQLRDRGETTRAGARNNVDLFRTAMENATSRANNESTTGAAIYGHELSRAGTRAQLEYERMKGDRQFGLEKQKFGEEQATHNYQQREQSIKDVHNEIGNMLPPVNDGSGKMVPDTQTASRYAQGLATLLGERQQQLAQRAQTGDKQAAAQLQELSTKGVGALSAADKQRFVAGMKATDLANQYHSGDFNPIGGTGVATTAPVKSMKRVSSLTGDYYKTDTGAKIPARAVEKENADFFGGKHRVDLNVLTQ